AAGGGAGGDGVGVSYDPMIAKLIASGTTRDGALDRLAAALLETGVGGLVTNLPFLRWLVDHPALRAGRTTTAFLVDHPPLSTPAARIPVGAWQGAWRLNLAPPPPHAPPGGDPAGRQDAGVAEQSTVTAPMPGTVL